MMIRLWIWALFTPLSRQIPRTKRQGQQFFHRRLVDQAARLIRQVDDCASAKLRQHLPAGPAGGAGIGGNHGNGDELAFALRNRLENRHPFGADSIRVGGVFDVHALVDFSG